LPALRITEVSPRDGLQNESRAIPSGQKLRLLELLLDSGVDEIEVTSFVSPKWVPQLGDAAAVCDGLVALLANRAVHGKLNVTPMFSALVPNEKGLTSALEANQRAATKLGNAAPLLSKVSVFTAASQSFSQRNTNASIAETIERFVPVVKTAHEHSLLVRGYISCVIACPFEGPVDPQRVVEVADLLVQIGVDELDLGDTIGAATPETTAALLRAVMSKHKSTPDSLTLHLHDTFGRAGECAALAYTMGIRSFDGAVGGLGGCPYAGTPDKPAPGNVDTRVLLASLRNVGGVHATTDDGLSGAAQWVDELRSGRFQS
jgi:hydroxymethylglutaryl-CoA lyase